MARAVVGVEAGGLDEWCCAHAATREVPIQVNGKLRDRITVPVGTEQDELERLVLARPRVTEVLGGRRPDRVIHAGGRLVNLVVRDL